MSDQSHESTAPPEPWEGYAEASAKDILSRLRQQDPESDLIDRVKAYEASRPNPRSTIVEFEPPASPEAKPGHFTREVWRELARQTFGVSPHAVAGALHDVDPSEMISEADVQRRLEDFSQRTGVEEDDSE